MEDIDWQNLSKQERRQLKKQRKRERKEQENKAKKKKNLKKLILIGLPVVVIIIALLLLPSIIFADSPKIHMNSYYHDFGNVVVGGDPVSVELDVMNTGKKDLVISGMDTSCGCTSAAFVLDGKEGPRFGMASHGTNPRDWSVTLKPGESGKLKIYYNPNVHKDMRGPVTRSVTVYSNDPTNSGMKVTIEATQV